MTSRLVVRPQAAAELLEAQQWFDQLRLGLGREFGLEVDRTISEVLIRPRAFHEFTVRCGEPSFIVFPTASSFKSSGTRSWPSASFMDIGIQKAGGGGEV